MVKLSNSQMARDLSDDDDSLFGVSDYEDDDFEGEGSPGEALQPDAQRAPARHRQGAPSADWTSFVHSMFSEVPKEFIVNPGRQGAEQHYSSLRAADVLYSCFNDPAEAGFVLEACLLNRNPVDVLQA